MNRSARRIAIGSFLFCAALCGAALCGVAVRAAADEPSTAVWKARGTPAMYQALSRAKAGGKRVLVALPGGDGCCGDVPIDRGAIAAGLEKEPFLALAASCETVLVEPPEGALVARAYGVERPGLLMLDGDGRWLSAVALPAGGGATLAKDATAILVPAGGTKSPAAPVSKITITGGSPTDAQVQGLTSLSGVLTAAREGQAVVVTGVREVVDPDAITAALGVAKSASSHVLRRWKLAGLEKTKAGLAMLRAAIGIRGVLSIRPDRPNKTVALLVDSTFDEAALVAAWKEAYAEATTIP